MKLYDILPASRTSRLRSEHFTYTSEVLLSPGDVVEVPLGRQNVLGVVIGETVAAPHFRLRAITRRVIPGYLSAAQLSLLHWMAEYYHVSQGLLFPLFLTGLSSQGLVEVPRLSVESANSTHVAPKLTSDQQKVLTALQKASNAKKSQGFLLHGVTGSGKTEIYLRWCEEVLKSKKQAVVLVPEIALTPQIVSRFASRIPQVVSYHSKLTPKQKREVASRVFSGEPCVVIGPRSALFLPFRQLGAIILDEEHDSSFQQFDKTPRYDARTVARAYADILTIPVLFGDATPRLETYHDTEVGTLQKLTLTKRISESHDDIPLPALQIVDFVDELKNKNKSPLSRKLHAAIGEALHNHEQVFLFLNRRGFASSILCFSCRNVIVCSNCSTPLVLHNRTLLCHHCGFHMMMPLHCPSCGKQALRAQGLGTERLEAEVKKYFPAARIARIDSDTMKHRDHYHGLYEKLMAHEIDIVIGTQMIAQGFDIPQVALVGIVQVDSILNLPDFHAEERAFQILTQVAGRAGRRKHQGRVILQTFFPNHWVFAAVANHDYTAFYQTEIASRKKFRNPPFAHLVQLTFHHKDSRTAEKNAEALASRLQKTGLEVFGPSPAFIPRKRGEWYWQILLSAENLDDIPFDIIPETWDSTIDPQSLLS